MTEKQKIILKEYLEDLKRQKKRTTSHKYGTKTFFKYVNESDIDFLRLKVSEAEGFQVYLSTRVRDDGSMIYCKASVLTIIGSLTSFYEYLKKKRLIYSNPLLEVQRVKRNKSLPRNIFDEEKMSKFLKHLRGFLKGKNLRERIRLYKAHVVSELMYSTGARINEVMRMKPEDVDFTRNIVRVRDSKTGKARDCILNEYASKVLKIYVDDMREYVLTGKNKSNRSLLFGTKTNLKILLNSILNSESKRLKFGRFTTHNFRHAVGYHLLRAGCDIRYIQEILGHRDLATTQVYTKVDKVDLKNVIDRYHPRMFNKREDEKL